jgi:predicted nucleic acid-binding protein
VTTVVIDTYVLASGFAGFRHPTRAPAQLLHLWRAGAFELVFSEHIFRELARTFQQPYFLGRITPE